MLDRTQHVIYFAGYLMENQDPGVQGYKGSACLNN